MRLHKEKRRPRSWGINIAPLIDVVFLLIIFFMTVSRFASAQAEPLDLPEAERGEKPSPAAAEKLTINVDPEGKVFVSGKQMAGVAELEGILAGQRRAAGAAHVKVLLRGDRRTAWRHVARVMDVCRHQDITRVRVAVTRPENPPIAE